MATSLQLAVERDPARTAAALTARLGVPVHAPVPVAGAGSANETLVARTDGLGEIVVRVVSPYTPVFPGSTVARQAAAMAHVGAAGRVPVPRVLDVDPDGAVLGRPMLVTARAPGAAPLDFPSYAVSGFVTDLAPEQRHALWAAAVDVLVALHATETHGLRLPDLPQADEDVLGERLEYLLRYRHDLAAPIDPVVDIALDALVAEVPALPSGLRGLSWGDARYGNLLVDGTAVTAVLDWELVTLAGPLFDLAWFSMFDRIHAEDLGRRLEGLGTPSESVARWSERTGLPAHGLAWHELHCHVHLAMIRTRAFADRAAAGLPTPGPDDPRSVSRLTDRVRILLERGELP